MENSENTENFIPPFQTPEAPKRKAPVALIIAVIVLLLGLLGLGTAYYFQMSQAKDLQRQVNDLNTAAAEMGREMAGMSDRTEAVYREIPELGVKYKLTDETKDLTYYYLGSETAQSVGFSTVSLTLFEDMNTKDEDKFPCTSKALPAGGFTRFKEGEKLQVGASEVTSTNKKIGEYYYLLQGPQFACGSDDETALVEGQKGVKAVQKAFETLEAM